MALLVYLLISCTYELYTTVYLGSQCGLLLLDLGLEGVQLLRDDGLLLHLHLLQEGEQEHVSCLPIGPFVSTPSNWVLVREKLLYRRKFGRILS